MKNKKNIIITGASGQVGLGLVKALKSEFNIIPIVRSVQKDNFGLKYFCCKNLADKDESHKAFNEIIDEYQSIDCLINMSLKFSELATVFSNN